MSYLQIFGVGKSFTSRSGTTEVLDDVNLIMDRGEFVAIVGFSGSGKSTLMNMVAGLVAPDRGVIRLEGQPITGPGPDRMLVFQNYSLLPWLTAYENVKLAVDQVFPQWEPGWRKKHVEQYLGMVNLSHAMDRKPAQLSGGMRQRVAVARALACEPRVMLLDEPFGALDALTRASLQDELLRIRSRDDRTVLMITNDVDEALLLADRIIPLTHGPRATLGPSVPVTIASPRDRKSLNHDPEFKRLRKEVTDFLLASAAEKRRPVSRTTNSIPTVHKRPAEALV
jgi:nitrate/nitrite transport system ATP-binding protein